jgi:hypothetical protein
VAFRKPWEARNVRNETKDGKVEWKGFTERRAATGGWRPWGKAKALSSPAPFTRTIYRPLPGFPENGEGFRAAGEDREIERERGRFL